MICCGLKQYLVILVLSYMGYIGKVVPDTPHPVPMHRTGTKRVDASQHKIVCHYDVVMMCTNHNIFIGYLICIGMV